jgi:hypothetical protein
MLIQKKPAVGSGDEVILVVLSYPQHAEIDEADHVHEHLRRKLAPVTGAPLFFETRSASMGVIPRQTAIAL